MNFFSELEVEVEDEPMEESTVVRSQESVRVQDTGFRTLAARKAYDEPLDISIQRKQREEDIQDFQR